MFYDAFERPKVGFLHQSGFQKVVDGDPKPVVDPNLREN